MRALVTGAAGFVGSYVTEKLLNEGYEVNILDHHVFNKNLSDEVINKTTFFEGDIRDETIVSKAIVGCDIVFHFASLVGVDAYSKHKVLTMEIEGDGLKNICKFALQNNCEKIIYPSSSAVYGRQEKRTSLSELDLCAPISNYAIAKRYNEIYLESLYAEKELQSVCLRIFNVYGPRQDDRLVIPRFVAKAFSNENIEIYGDGKQTRDFVYIDDVVTAAIYAAKLIDDHEVINVSNGIGYSISDVAECILKNTNSTSEVIYKEIPKKRNTFEVETCTGDIAKLKKITKFRPDISLDEGIKRTCEFIKEKL